MENTCQFEKCAFAKRLKLRSAQECNNYIESWWTQKDEKPVLISDCAPKRTMLMVMDLNNRLIGVQQSQEQQRNALQPLDELINMAKIYQNALPGG